MKRVIYRAKVDGKHLATKPTIGTGVIIEGVPVFVPMV